MTDDVDRFRPFVGCPNMDGKCMEFEIPLSFPDEVMWEIAEAVDVSECEFGCSFGFRGPRSCCTAATLILKASDTGYEVVKGDISILTVHW